MCISTMHYVIECSELYDLCSIVTQNSIAKKSLTSLQKLLGRLTSKHLFTLSLVAMPHHRR